MEQIELDTALRSWGEVQEVVVLGTLPEAVALELGLETIERIVCLHPNTAHHIYLERGFEDGEAELVFDHLPRVIARPHYCGRDPRAPRRYDLVHLTEEREGAVFAALKVVDAAVALSGRDEIWVSTAHRLPANFLSRKRYRDSLRALGWP